MFDSLFAGDADLVRASAEIGASLSSGALGAISGWNDVALLLLELVAAAQIFAFAFFGVANFLTSWWAFALYIGARAKRKVPSRFCSTI